MTHPPLKRLALGLGLLLAAAAFAASPPPPPAARRPLTIIATGDNGGEVAPCG